VRRLVLAVATVGGVRFLPAAPGTAASLVVVPFVPWLVTTRGQAPVAYGLGVVLVVVVAIWGAGRAERVFGRHDDGCVVVDEVAGMVVATIFIPPTWGAAVLLFAAFRLFDIAKPPPIDLLAGLYAGVLTRLVIGLP